MNSAQWPEMGKELIERVPAFRQTLDFLDAALQDLPDAPKWTLVDELIAPAGKSSIEQAAFSQPLCTTIQIALVDLLSAAGVTFQYVVGQSSGEIGAAYAAGRLTS